MPAGSYTKVVNIWMENKDANAIVGSSSAPFANQMANTYGSATNFPTIVHPSLPNYVAATSGGTQGITDDAAPSSHPLRVQSIFGELDAAGKSWKAYQEGMTSNCMKLIVKLTDKVSCKGQGPKGARYPPGPTYPRRLGTRDGVVVDDATYRLAGEPPRAVTRGWGDLTWLYRPKG